MLDQMLLRHHAGGLESIICLAHNARVMFTSNLWVDRGLVTGAMGTVVAICCCNGRSPPNLPIAVTVRFDTYRGPTLSDGTVPITPLRRTWSAQGGSYFHLQLPLKLAWAITIHKAQGLTLDKVVIDIGKMEFLAGLMFVTCSCVRSLKDLLFDPPFPFQRIANLANSQRVQERLLEDDRLLHLDGDIMLVSPPVNHSNPSQPSTSDAPCMTIDTLSPHTTSPHACEAPWMDGDTSPLLQSDAPGINEDTSASDAPWIYGDTPSPPAL